MSTPLAGFNTILMGPPGSGKTYAVSTLCDTPLEVFVLFLEPGLETLVGAFTDPPPRGRGKPLPPNLHYHVMKAPFRDFKRMGELAEMVGKFDLKALANYRDTKRADYNPIFELYKVLNDFPDDRTGKKFGPVDSWGPDRVLVIDGLTGFGDFSMEMMTGDKPVRDKPDYGIAQTNLLSALRKLTSGCACHFVLLAHVDRLTDEVMGGVKLMIATIGQAIKGVISQPFSDVILTKREGDRFFWDTADSNADLKTRNLAIQSKLAPSFTALYTTWKARSDAVQKA